MPGPSQSLRKTLGERLRKARIAVVIPCYRVKRKVAGVIARIGPEVARIYCVDDACPEHSGKHIKKTVKDRRVRVLSHGKNLGVGGAVKTGYRAALEDGMVIVVKVDGDGQIDPTLIPAVVAPILAGRADYVKGNRFYHLEDMAAMPKLRVFGNAGLSFLAKLSSGYWSLFDPNNGLTAIHALALKSLPLKKVADNYFFESDMLFRLNTIGATVCEVPMKAVYGDETSGISEISAAFRFLFSHLRNFAKRIFYNYLLRDFNIASIELLLGVFLLLFGVIFGALEWANSIRSGVPVTSGTVMLAALPVILGVQFLLGFFGYDTRARHTRPLFMRHVEPPAAGTRSRRRRKP